MKATNVVRFAFHAVAVGAKLIDLIRYKTKPMIILPAQPGSRKICRTHCVRFHLMTRARETCQPTPCLLTRRKINRMVSSPQCDNPGDSVKRLQFVLHENRQSRKGGTYAVCSAHPAVIEAAIRQSIADESLLHVESTSSQVNQFGGYTSMAPSQFADWIHSSAKNAGLAEDPILLGGDHLGLFPWRLCGRRPQASGIS